MKRLGEEVEGIMDYLRCKDCGNHLVCEKHKKWFLKETKRKEKKTEKIECEC